MEHPKVSVIIPVYHVEQYIERCARSLFSQTLDDIEFLFVDDCSPDHSILILQHIIEEYQTRILEKHWIVKIERMPYNSGQAVVRQYAIQIATGDYIIHCDSDDWVDSKMMSEMWNLARNKNLDVVVCDYDHIKKHETIKHKCLNSCDSKLFFDEVVSIFASWSLCNKLIKRSLYTDRQILFPSKGMNVGEDMALVIQLLYYCESVGYIEKAFYHYIENDDSISNKKTVSGVINNYIQWISNVCLLESFFQDKDIYERIEKKLSYIVIFATDEALTRLDMMEKSMYYLISLLCFKVWRSNTITSYGKRRVGKYMKRMVCSSLYSKVHNKR